MSTYTTRIIEIKILESKGYLNDINVFPEGIQNGDIYSLPYNLRTDDKKYCKFVDGSWEYLESCPSHWELVEAYVPRGPRKKQQTVLVDEYDENLKPTGRKVEQPVGPMDTNAYLFKDESGNDRWFKIESEWYNNGGFVRDDYISKFNDSKIKERGLPENLSDKTKELLDKSEAHKYGYSFTWCTLQEWYDIYDEKEAEILKKLEDLFIKKHLLSSDKKLDFIIKNLGKNPSDKERKKVLSTKGKNEDKDEYDFDEELSYIKEEELPVLWAIGYEIGRIESFVDMYDELGNSSNTRIIYYLS